MVGGGELLREFFKNNLIDEYVVTITPHILGSEFRYFKTRTEINLTLMDTKRFGQFVNLYYSKVIKTRLLMIVVFLWMVMKL